MIPLSDDTPRFSTPFVTYFIIALNAVVFVFELSVGEQSHRALNSLMYQFGVVPVHFERALAGWAAPSLAGLFLPLLTSMFLHASWLHLIGNMWFLWIFGDNIEDHLGHFTYLLFYLVSGFAAAVAHILLNAGSNRPERGSEWGHCRRDGGVFRALPASPRADVVSTDFSLSPARMAGAGILVLYAIYERSGNLDCGDQPERRNRFLGSRGRLRGWRRTDQDVARTAATISVCGLVSKGTGASGLHTLARPARARTPTPTLDLPSDDNGCGLHTVIIWL